MATLIWATARELAAIHRRPVGTIYRWAHEDRWRRQRNHRVRYAVADAEDTAAKRPQRGGA